MLDPCKLTPTQCFVMRVIGGDAFGIIEIPKMASVPLEGFSLTMLSSCHMDNHYTRCEWSNGKDRGEEVEIEFHWRDWICEGRPQSDGAGFLFADGVGIDFEPVTHEEAMSNGILAYLDYYRTTAIQKSSNTMPLDITCKYVGKIEPGSTSFPKIPEEPVDSHVLPQRRPSRIMRIARERKALEQDGGETKQIEFTGETTYHFHIGSLEDEVIEADFEEG